MNTNELAVGTRIRIPRRGIIEITGTIRAYGDRDFYEYRRVLGHGTAKERLSTNAYHYTREYVESLEVVA